MLNAMPKLTATRERPNGMRQALTALGLSAVLATCIALIPGSRVAACSCISQTPEQALNAAAAVFEGVVAAGPLDEGRQAAPNASDPVFRFAIDAVVKGGPLPGWIDVATMEGTSCGIGLARGNRWRIFAGDSGSALFVEVCAPNELLAERAPIPPWVPIPPEPAAPGNPLVATGPGSDVDAGIPPGLLIAAGTAGLLLLASAIAFRRRTS